MDFNGRASGALVLADLARVAAHRRDVTRLRDVTRRRKPMIVARSVLLADIAAKMRLHGGIAVVVDDFNHPIGLVTGAELLRASRAPAGQ